MKYDHLVNSKPSGIDVIYTVEETDLPPAAVHMGNSEGLMFRFTHDSADEQWVTR